jgi:hypothetical protein
MWHRRSHIVNPSMGRLINSDDTVTRLWSPITFRNPENRGDMFSATSFLTRGTRQKVTEDIYQCVGLFGRMLISVIRPLPSGRTTQAKKKRR